MNAEHISEAKKEAKRFLDRVSAWEEAQLGGPSVWEDSNGAKHKFNLHTPCQSGALRRASLDLTRALAVMRKP